MKKHLSIRIDYNTYSKLMDQANQDGLTVSESVRNLLEKQTSNETPIHQDETSIKEQASNENHSEENQDKRNSLVDFIRQQTNSIEETTQEKQTIKMEQENIKKLSDKIDLALLSDNVDKLIRTL